MEQVLAAIGETFDEGEEVCGIVVNIRTKQDRISIWTKTASNESAQVIKLRKSPPVARSKHLATRSLYPAFFVFHHPFPFL
eukprot:9252025-Pyramimonas_sp.AAC.1